MEGQGVAEIGRDPKMPTERTIFRWLAADDKFCQRYTRAKEVSAEFMAEEMLDIADNASNDWMERNDKDGHSVGWQINGEAVNRSRLRLDTRKWLMEKLKPKKYGQTTKVDLGGSLEVTEMTDTERATRLAALITKGMKVNDGTS